MSDIAERLRAITGQAGDHGDVQLCMAAAAEIARLRLTDAERAALDYVCRNVLPDGSREGDDALHSLRMLLRRTQ